MVETTICFDINSDLLFLLDSYLLKMKRDKPKQHYSRRKVLEEALQEYLKNKCCSTIKDDGLLINAIKRLQN
jgi:hypothetical protein